MSENERLTSRPIHRAVRFLCRQPRQTQIMNIFSRLTFVAARYRFNSPSTTTQAACSSRFVRESRKQLLTNFVSVKHLNCCDRTIDYINDEIPSAWFKSHRPRTRSIRSLRLGTRIERGAKI